MVLQKLLETYKLSYNLFDLLSILSGIFSPASDLLLNYLLCISIFPLSSLQSFLHPLSNALVTLSTNLLSILCPILLTLCLIDNKNICTMHNIAVFIESKKFTCKNLTSLRWSGAHWRKLFSTGENEKKYK